ncbi:P-loop containing nucleoside triphosphate hydrolase protein [Microthyrium microscopicum]|uniref:P-loop containing nucleoside triphosphate hydrolase protein n=1 Tax=Microthyrium microscopicum TaxID=703497 RepID=A0A6A6UFB0_9PEZI|nr:P-loop containing nucleoside triphosphate hydrolase protein [Microthyrium microscopicum]
MPRKPVNQAFNKWRKHIPNDYDNEPKPLGETMPSFLIGAMLLLKDNPATMQQIIPLFASPGGQHRLAELVERCEQSLGQDDYEEATFRAEVMILFEILARHDVMTSPVISDPLKNIYRFLWGENGKDFRILFNFVHVCASKNLEKTNVVYVLSVYHSFVGAESQARSNEGYRDLGQKLLVLAKAALPNANAFDQPEIEQLIEKIEKTVLQASSPAAGSAGQASSSPSPPKYLVPKRHDNDFEDICRVSILPTVDEATAHRAGDPYLPTLNPRSWIDGGESATGLLDRQFRLLREDTVGPIRDAVRAIIVRNGFSAPSVGASSASKLNQDAARTFVYTGLEFLNISVDSFIRGIQVTVAVNQPSHLKEMPIPQRARWWETSKRLQNEALVCIVQPGVDGKPSVVFCTITSILKRSNDKRDQGPRPSAPIWERYGLSGHKQQAFVTLTLVNTDKMEGVDADISRILQEFPKPASPNWQSKSILVEFPNIVLPSFEPTLKALQNMKVTGQLPFSSLLAPTGPKASGQTVSIRPPHYTLKPGFAFNLKCLMKDGKDLFLDSQATFDATQLQNQSSLDATQAEAVVHALTRQVSLIQGPPGTGKSYCGIALTKVLIDNGVGPVLAVCYTNHALDQLLEHLVKSGMEGVIRMGSQSKSELLEPFNLRNVMMGNSRTAIERSARNDINKDLDGLRNDVEALVEQIKDAGSWSSIEGFLRRQYALHLKQILALTPASSTRSPLDFWLRGGTPIGNAVRRSAKDLQNSRLDSLTKTERSQLYEYWISVIKADPFEKLRPKIQSWIESQGQLEEVRISEQVRTLQKASVIGVTSSGLARNLNLLNCLDSKVVLMEEAGELLEAHSVTSLIPTVEHAILIGDHLQLRGQVNNYSLSSESSHGRQYALDVSLFERLVAPLSTERALVLPFTTLEVQRRMHPSISDLIRQSLYPKLLDESSVVGAYPAVKGMDRRLFWLDHHQPEEGADGSDTLSNSRSNQYEVEKVSTLVAHLVKNGYSTGQKLAILTPYVRQLQLLRRALSRHFEVALSEKDQAEMEKQGLAQDAPVPQMSNLKLNKDGKATLLDPIRVATVDNFQGEEADVIVISLVRSNAQRNCGFLRTSNRINVLLSRARHGCYLIGNAATAESVPMWATTIRLLKKGSNFGQALPYC